MEMEKDFKELLLPTLKVLYDEKKEMEIKEIDEQVRVRLNLSDDVYSVKIPNRNQNEFSYRCSWARTFLKKFGLIENIDRGIWKISDLYDGSELTAEDIIQGVQNKDIFRPLQIEPELPDVEKNNAMYLHSLREMYKKKDVVLMLGAGVSMASGLPSWEELISNFFIQCFQKKYKKNFDEDKLRLLEKVNRTNSPITYTRFIKQDIEPGEYMEFLEKTLYPKINEIQLDTALLNAICHLIRYNNEIHISEIITYNFDNLLEEKLSQKEINFCKYNKELTHKNDVRIYHVHGYLPYDSNPDEIDLDNMVFSEEQYHRVYNNPYSKSNVIQARVLLEKSCFFIGCSLNDPNIRRLLDVTNGHSKKQHYAILPKPLINIPKGMENEIISKCYKDFHLRNIASNFESLGVRVIWVDDVDEIPEFLNKICE